MSRSIVMHVRESFANLVASKLRSFLAILGVLVGTGSVVALIASSQLATQHALLQFKALGTNLLAMTIDQKPGVKTTSNSPQFTVDDIPKLLKSSPQAVVAAPYTSLFEKIDFQGISLSGEILGATDTLAEIVKIKMARGRFVSFFDRNSSYCVIGSKIAKKIEEKGIDPLYKQIRLGANIFTVIGVADKWTPNLFLYANINNGVIIPIKASRLLQQDAQISNVLIRLVKDPDIDAAQKAIKNEMETLFPDKSVHFQNPETIIGIVNKQRETFTWLLGAIGGISLLVGGIGVMNIMLVSVVERRQEIGIRMAIGARRSDILKMFLMESIILTLFGGILGILLGIGASYVLAVTTGWQFFVYALPPILGFVVSVLVGILSGFYPALRASRLDPIQTLTGD